MNDLQRLRAASTWQAGNQATRISAELVQQVADRVYAMLLRDLRIEQERRRITSSQVTELNRYR